jgi:hypothetical protein
MIKNLRNLEVNILLYEYLVSTIQHRYTVMCELWSLGVPSQTETMKNIKNK